MFDQLLNMALTQDQPQRLLFLFANSEPTNPDNGKIQRGQISPVMCVDKLATEVTDFKALVKEADSVAKDWDFVFVAGLSGENGQAPSTEQAEPYLNKMTNDVASGNNIASYVVLDRDENPIELMVN